MTVRPNPTAVVVLGALLFSWNLWGYDLWAPDEPYFAEGAREMVVDGRWFVPHVNGVVTTDKPPLFFWLIAVFSLPLGQVTSWTARLPSALAAVGSLALTVRLARRRYGDDTARMAALILATCYLFWDKARSAQIDSLLCFLILAALYAFDAFRSGEARGRPSGLAFWFLAALAVLAKGPVGLLIPLGVALSTLAFDRDLGAWRRFAPLSGPVLFAAVTGAWAAAATLGSGDYSVWGAFREHVLDRAVHGMHHAQPPWYYLEVLPVKLLPWTGLLPGAVVLAWRRRARPGDRFLLVFAVFVVLFFSIPTEKRDLYVLPAFPPLALLAARLVGEGSRDDLPGGWFRIPQSIVGTVIALAGVGLLTATGRFEPVPAGVATALACVLVAGGTGIAWTAATDRVRMSVGCAAATGVAAYVLASTVVFPSLDSVKSARSFSLEIARRTAASREAGNEVLAYRLGNLPEAFSFYTNGIYFREAGEGSELAGHLESGGVVYAVADADALGDLPPGVRERISVVDRTVLSRMQVVLISNGARAPGTSNPDRDDGR